MISARSGRFQRTEPGSVAYRPAIARSAIHTGAAPDHAASGLRHPRRLVIVALVGFLASAVVAWSDRPPSWELRITEWFTEVPDAGVAVLWPVMQLGTAWAPLLAAAVVLAITRDGRRAAVTLLAGLASWFLAKAVKELFQRGRPLEFLPSIDVREGAGTGLGFVSGHAAVAATCAVCIVAVLPVRIRPVAAGIALLVGLARIAYGLHLPADVVGGWSLGVLVGVLATYLSRPGAGCGWRCG